MGRKGRNVVVIPFLAPALVLYTVFFIYPAIQAFYISLTEWSGYGEPRYIGLKNFGELIRDPESESHRCIACLQCQTICPSACIAVEGEKVPGSKKKRPTLFTMHYELCSLCGLCVDNCPTDALQHSDQYEDVTYLLEGMVHDLLAPFPQPADEAEGSTEDGAAPAQLTSEEEA